MPDPSSPIPHPKPSDHEDVSWALSTAEATWRRGDHADALKWLQRAAEAASEAGLDTRYLELAKASSELAGHIESSPRMAQPTNEDPHPSGSTLVQPMGVVLPEPGRKSTTSGPPPLPGGRTAPPARPSSPSPPRAGSKPSPSRVPAPMPSRPAVGATKVGGKSDPPAMNKSGGGSPSPKPPPPAESGSVVKTGERRVSENLRTVRNLDKMTHLDALTRSEDGGRPQTVERPLESEDETQITGPSSAAPLTEVHPTLERESEPEIEPWPTQTAKHDATLVTDPSEPPSVATQALRVVLYRTPDGVRIAPAGAKLPAISVDAMLVALDPSVDLTAWLK